MGGELLRRVRKDINMVLQVCRGELKQTNNLRGLIGDLTKATIPKKWNAFKIPKIMTVSQWIPNLGRRLAQLSRIQQAKSFHDVEVWLGGLFFPEAYITATRQAVSHRRNWSLETLRLHLDIEKIQDPNAFVIEGLHLEGALWSSTCLSLNDGSSVPLGPSQIRWTQIGESVEQAAAVTLPVYLNSDRTDVLFTVELPFLDRERHLVPMRAVCLSANANLL